MEGNGKVRRFFSAVAREDEAADTPAIRRKAPRNVSLIFIRFFRSAGVPPAVARASRPRCQKKSPAIRSGASGREVRGGRGFPSAPTTHAQGPLFLDLCLEQKSGHCVDYGITTGTNGNLERLPAICGAMPATSARRSRFPAPAFFDRDGRGVAKTC